MRVKRACLLVLLAAALADCGGGSGQQADAPVTSTTRARLKLPVVDVAETVACQAEARTIVTAEDAYAALNGAVGSLDDLVSEGYLRAASENYRAVRVGVPAGGYTLVGVPGRCVDWPIAG
jgi:hypothetical protein